MAFGRLRPSGLWVPRSAVTPAEFETFDENLSNAVDGADGGAYAPTNPIQFGGDGIEFAGISGDNVRDAIPGISRGMTLSWPSGALLESLAETGWVRASLTTGSNVGVDAWTWQGTVSGNKVVLPLVGLPRQGTLVAVRIWVASRGGSGTPADLPVTKPTLKVFKTIWDTAPPNYGPVVSQIGTTTTEPATTLAQYRERHYVAVTGLSESLGLQEAYSIEIAGSSGDSGDNTDDYAILTIECDLEE